MENRNDYIIIPVHLRDRAIFRDAKTLSLWLHMMHLAKLGAEDMCGLHLLRGQFASSYISLGMMTGMTANEVKDCIGRLKREGDVDYQIVNGFMIFTMLKFDDYVPQ